MRRQFPHPARSASHTHTRSKPLLPQPPTPPASQPDHPLPPARPASHPPHPHPPPHPPPPTTPPPPPPASPPTPPASRPGAHLVQHSVQLVARLADAVAVVAIHHKDQALRVLEVVPPQGADLQSVGGQSGGGARGRGRWSERRFENPNPLSQPASLGAAFLAGCPAPLLCPPHGFHARSAAPAASRCGCCCRPAPSLPLPPPLLPHACWVLTDRPTLSWPPTSHTVKLMFLYSTVSTLKPAGRQGGRGKKAGRGGRSGGGRSGRRPAGWRMVQAAAAALPRPAGCTRGPCCAALPVCWSVGPPGARGHRPSHAPMVGMVVTISPSFSLYKMVVLPAASRPTCTAARGQGRAERAGRANKWGAWGIAWAAPPAHHQNPHLLLGEEPAGRGPQGPERRGAGGSQRTQLLCSPPALGAG